MDKVKAKPVELPIANLSEPVTQVPAVPVSISVAEPVSSAAKMDAPLESPAVPEVISPAQVSDGVVAPVVPSNVVQFGSPTSITPEAPIMEETEEIEDEPDRKTSKWVLLIVVLVLLICAAGAGAVYYMSQFGSSSSSKQMISPQPEGTENTVKPSPTPMADEQIDQLKDVQADDSVDSIKKDVNSTDLTNLGSDLNQIDQDLGTN